MIKIRCKKCNKELESHPVQTKCCGCDNLTTVRGDKISGVDLSLVELISFPTKTTNTSYFTKEELAEQEARRNRKVRKMEFDVR